MLVYFKQPKGSIRLDGVLVHGFAELQEPSRISWECYKNHRKMLVQACYNKERLERLFPNGDFPNISFTYSDLRYLTWEQLCDLCKGFGIKTNRKSRLRLKKLRRFMKAHC